METIMSLFSLRRGLALSLLAGALATLGRTEEALAILARYRESHPQDRVAADLERAIRADAANPSN